MFHALSEARALLSEVRFETSDYVFSYGKEPKGSGQWIFFLGKKNVRASDHDYDKYAFSYNGSYGDAKKAAEKEAKKRGVDVVYVGS